MSPPPAGSCLIDHLWFLFPLCCQSMFLMSFWLCNALRSNTSQSNLSWHCVQLIWQWLGSLFFSKVVIFLMSWNPCLGVDACFASVLCYVSEFWKDSAFQFHVSLGAVSNISYFTLFVSVSHAFCTAHNFCHSQIEAVLVLCPISHNTLAQYLIINTLFLYLRSCWKGEFLSQHQKKARRYVCFVLEG